MMNFQTKETDQWIKENDSGLTIFHQTNITFHDFATWNLLLKNHKKWKQGYD